MSSRASTTASVLTALDERLVAVAKARTEARDEKDKWESGVQAAMKDIQEKRDKKKGGRGA